MQQWAVLQQSDFKFFTSQPYPGVWQLPEAAIAQTEPWHNADRSSETVHKTALVSLEEVLVKGFLFSFVLC